MAEPTPNETTIATYEASVERYVQDTPRKVGGPAEAFMHKIIARVGARASVLELGSGPGDDAAFLEDQGLRVRRTDATRAFVDRLREHGYQAQLLNVLTDDFGGPWDLVFANAMLLHLSRDELSATLIKAREAVQPDSGVLAFSVKDGDGEEWTTARLDLPRHVTYWREAALRELLARTGWVTESVDSVVGRNDNWLYVICGLAR